MAKVILTLEDVEREGRITAELDVVDGSGESEKPTPAETVGVMLSMVLDRSPTLADLLDCFREYFED